LKDRLQGLFEQTNVVFFPHCIEKKERKKKTFFPWNTSTIFEVAVPCLGIDNLPPVKCWHADKWPPLGELRHIIG
jgi:hypothetical protein